MSVLLLVLGALLSARKLIRPGLGGPPNPKVCIEIAPAKAVLLILDAPHIRDESAFINGRAAHLVRD